MVVPIRAINTMVGPQNLQVNKTNAIHPRAEFRHRRRMVQREANMMQKHEKISRAADKLEPRVHRVCTASPYT